jgi:hypothetical protein
MLCTLVPSTRICGGALPVLPPLELDDVVAPPVPDELLAVPLLEELLAAPLVEELVAVPLLLEELLVTLPLVLLLLELVVSPPAPEPAATHLPARQVSVSLQVPFG